MLRTIGINPKKRSQSDDKHIGWGAEPNQPDTQLLNGYVHLKQMLFWLNLASKISLENMIWLRLLRLCGHLGTLLFSLSDFKFFNKFCLIFYISFLQPDYSLLSWSKWTWDCLFFALLSALLARSTHQFHRPLCAWITDVWRREKNRSRHSHHPTADRRPSGTTVGAWGHGGHYQKYNYPSSLLRLCLPFSPLLSWEYF